MQQRGWLRLRTREGLKVAGGLSAAVWLAETQDMGDRCMPYLDGSYHHEGLRASGVLGAAGWLAGTQDT